MKKKITIFITILVILFFGWLTTEQPRNDRDWSLDQAIIPEVHIGGDTVSIKNIRDFSYRSTSDYTPEYYDQTFNLRDLTRVWYIVEPFGSIGAAHTFVSFEFGVGDFVAVSIEIRKEKGESFSPWKGVLRQYELAYVIASERDAIGLRAVHRKDDVYLYPVKTTPEKARALFLSMVSRAEKLRTEPEFYNTLFSNCTTNIARHANEISTNRIPWDFRLILPEHSDLLAYKLGLLDIPDSPEKVRGEYRINDRAEKFINDPNFSHRIRNQK